MKQKSLLFFLIVPFLFAACKSAKLDGPERYIIFGSGGGITGKVDTYKISSLGNFTVEDNVTPAPEIKVKLTKKTLKKIFDLADSLQKNIPRFSNPGNMYYFIYVKNNIERPDYTWGQNGFIAPEPVMRLYDMLKEVKSSVKILKK